MSKQNARQRASLSWRLEDYKKTGDEPPECIYYGKTEGEHMEPEEIFEWSNEHIRTLSVLKESYPIRYREVYSYYILDLEYLHSLGKISEEEKKELEDKENFNFGQTTKK